MRSGEWEARNETWEMESAMFRYHEVKHTKSGKSKEGMKSGKLGMGGLREAVVVGLPTRNEQKAC